MKRAVMFISGLIAAFSASAAASDADGPALLEKHHCKACHAVDLKIVGPSFRDVAKKYAGDASAPDKLAAKIKSGGSGVWGSTPMRANDVPDEDMKPLLAWILSRG